MKNVASNNQKIDVSVSFYLPYCLYLEDGIYSVKVNGINADVTLRKEHQKATDTKLEINFLIANEIEDNSLYTIENMVTNERKTVKGSELKKEDLSYQILEINNNSSPPLWLIATPTYYNCELKEDKRGIIRYTWVEMILRSIKKQEDYMDYALKVINRFIEIYRYVIKAHYMEKITLNDLYSFSYSEKGTGSFSFAYPPQSRVVPLIKDLSKSEHIEIREMLEDDKTPPFDSILLLDAKYFLEKEDYRRAVVECILAIEPWIEKFISSKLKEGEIPNKHRKDFFEKVTFSPQIKGLLKLFIKKQELNHQLIDDLIKTNTLRNKIIHEGFLDISRADAERAINCTEGIICFIKNKINNYPM
jgi:hypothetical protein